MSRRSSGKSPQAQGRAFIQAIQETPEDDAPRLIYADWLEDHGDADRAEFIRIQCRLAHLAEDDPDRPVLQHREAELLNRNRASWLGPWLICHSKAEFQR